MLAACIAVLLENSQSPLERVTIYKSPYFLLVFGPDGRGFPPLVIGQRPYMNAWFGTLPWAPRAAAWGHVRDTLSCSGLGIRHGVPTAQPP
jgi:hypothetical protein